MHLIHQHLHPVSSNDRTGFEAYELTAIGMMPVTEWYTSYRFIGVFIDRRDKLPKRSFIGRKCCRPHDPVGLSVLFTRIQRQTVRILFRKIIGA